MPIRAAVMTAPRQPLEIWDLPDPVMEQGSILLETVASEVCGTDVQLHHGRLSGVPYPIVPGHVSVGRVLEIRPPRTPSSPAVDVGALVTFYDVHETCHRCWFCVVAKQPNRCPSRKVYGITYSAHDGPLGGWAERIYLKPGVHLVEIPEGLDADDVIGGGCGLFTGFAAVERADVQMGDTVVIQGSGPVGLSAAAFAGVRGAVEVIVIGDPRARLELAGLLGADRTLSVSETHLEDRRAVVIDATGGRGADVIIEASGNPRAVEEGFGLARDGGRYVIAGHYTDTGTATVNPHLDINRKHLDVRGQWGTELGHVLRALRLLRKHRERLPFAKIVGGRYRLDQAEQAIRDVETLRVTKAIITP
jgi:threonine dehydrogenase-like Zn-dependent dehydrogenase